jgi:uncharacterized membrane protein (DUF2068 family)
VSKFDGPRALRAIILYKTIKAGIQLVTVLALLALWPFGLPRWIEEIPVALRHHATHGWAVYWASRLVGESTVKRLALSITALGADGALTLLEAWSLRSGRWWGPWLVVGAAAALLPFEIYEIVRAPRVSRFAIFALNLLIASYLALRAWREHLERSARQRSERK